MKSTNNIDLYIILMLTIGIPICTIMPHFDLPLYLMYPVQAKWIILLFLGTAASYVRIQTYIYKK